MRKQFRTLTSLAAILAAGCIAARAADKVGWEQLKANAGSIVGRNIDVLTRDGVKHHGRELYFEQDVARLIADDGSHLLARADIARIEVRQGGRFFRHLGDAAGLPVAAAFSNSGGDPIAFTFILSAFSPVWAYTIASTPVILVAEGIAHLLPPKVYELAER